MRFKSYSGKSLAEIVPLIREELGPGAVILKQRSTRSGGVGGFFARTGIEVLAADGTPDAVPAAAGAVTAAAVASPPAGRIDTSDAVSHEALLRETFSQALAARVEREAAEEQEPAVTEPVAVGQTHAVPNQARAAAAEAYAGRVRPFEPVRIGSERPAAGGLRLAPTPAAAPPPVPTLAPLDDEAADLALELERSGITAAGAEALVRELRFHVGPFADGSLRDLARRRIAAKIRVEHGWEPDGSARRIALVGASGVGKTTAVANLAAGLTRGGMTVGIIVIERRPEGEHAVLPRLGATGGSDADRALAYMAGTDVIRVGTPAEMRRAITRLAGRDAVLIDTPGLSRDDVALAELRDVLEAAVAHELHAVVPLGIADREAAAVLARLARLGATRLLVTKTDEARFAGPIYNLATGYELPLGYLGCAPTVPGGLTPADGGSIASRILPI